MKSPQPACPECEKLSAVAEKSNSIGEFLDWLREERNLVICEWYDGENPKDLSPAAYYQTQISIETLLAEYLEIDLNKVEQERMALLEWLREEK